jgi:hypothetical protein
MPPSPKPCSSWPCLSHKPPFLYPNIITVLVHSYERISLYQIEVPFCRWKRLEDKGILLIDDHPWKNVYWGNCGKDSPFLSGLEWLLEWLFRKGRYLYFKVVANLNKEQTKTIFLAGHTRPVPTTAQSSIELKAIFETALCYDQRYSPTKTKRGLNWNKKMVLLHLFSRWYYYFKFKGTSSFQFNKTSFSLHLLQKIASFYHISTRCKNLVAGQ